MRTHLTLTGIDSGRPICGTFKPDAIEQGDEFLHYVYLDRLNDRPEHYQPLCEGCREFVENPENWE